MVTLKAPAAVALPLQRTDRASSCTSCCSRGGGKLPQKHVLVMGIVILCLMVAMFMNQKSVTVVPAEKVPVVEVVDTATSTTSSSATSSSNTLTVTSQEQAEQNTIARVKAAQAAGSKTDQQNQVVKKEVKQRLKEGDDTDNNDYGFRLCQIKTPMEPTYQDRPVKVPREKSPLPIRFQCAGDAYQKQFGDKLQSLLGTHYKRKQASLTSSSTTRKQHQHQTKIQHWGQRPRPIPPKQMAVTTSMTDTTTTRVIDAHATATANINGKPQRTNILVFGSSHLRQIWTAILCQYSELVLQVQRIHGHTKHSLNSMSWYIVLRDNIHIYLVINPPVLYSPHWLDLLQRHILQMTLDKMDLIVMGPFHAYSHQQGQALLEFLMDHEGHHGGRGDDGDDDGNAKTTTKTRTTGDKDNDDDNNEDEDVDDDDEDEMTTAVEPPTYFDIVNLYKGPILYTGLFAAYGNSTLSHVQRSIRAMWEGRRPPPDPKAQKQKTVHKIKHSLHQIISPPPLSNQPLISERAQSLFTTRVQPPKIDIPPQQGRQRESPPRHHHHHHERQRQLKVNHPDDDDDDKDRDDLPRERTKKRRPDDRTNNNNDDDNHLIQTTSRRTNLIALDARKYVKALGECSTETFQKVGTCITDTNHPRYQQGHTCFGSKGGHADLIAWDVIEGMYRLLGKQTMSSKINQKTTDPQQ